MNQRMAGFFRVGFTLCVFGALIGAGVMLLLHPEMLKPHVAEEVEKPGESEVPVKVVAAKRMTLRQWAAGGGYVEPQLLGKDGASSALAASAVAGIVAKVECQVGKVVSPGDVLIQLDDRVAKGMEEQAAAALESARASLAKLKSTPRPEQIALAQLAVEKAREGREFASKALERNQLLSKSESVPAKAIEQAVHDRAVAENDLEVAQKQLALLKASPSAEELAEANAKVAEAERAAALAAAQRSLLTIRAPLKGTVVRIMAGPGEAVDPTKALVEVVALDRLMVNLSMPADQVGHLKVGQMAEILQEGENGAEGDGKASPAGTVLAVGFSADRKSNLVSVAVGLPGDTALRPGQFVQARILVDEHKDALAAPWAGVIRAEEDQHAVAVVHDEKATRVMVKLGLREGDWVEVMGDAIKAGDQIVTQGAYGLAKESKVHVGE